MTTWSSLRANASMYIFQPDRYLLQKQLRAVGHYISGKTLDVGAGTTDRYSGSFSASSYTRMEIAPGEGIDVVGSIYEIPFPDATFDSLVCTQVFEHLARPHDAVKELFRVLKPGGHLVMTVPQMNELHEEPYDFLRYTPYGIEAIFSDVGFSVVEKSQRGGFFATRAQLLIRYCIDRFCLYKRPLLGRVASTCFGIYGRLMLALDRRDTSIANRKHAIGWAYVFRK